MPFAPQTVKRPIRVAIELALVATAAVAVFAPSMRTAHLHSAICLLFFVEMGASFYTDWKAGLLGCTPRQLFERFRESGVPRSRPLATLALFMGFIAVVAIRW